MVESKISTGTNKKWEATAVKPRGVSRNLQSKEKYFSSLFDNFVYL